MRRWPAIVGRFLWDFIVGESPAAFVVTLVIVAVAFGLRDHAWVAAVVLPALGVAALVAGAYRGRRRSAGDVPTR
jgi:hypothetical protein